MAMRAVAPLLLLATGTAADAPPPVAILATASSAAEAVDIDIHLPVRGAAYDRVLFANRYLDEKLGSDGVDFRTIDTPHITLYLTSFSCPGTATTAAAQSSTNCTEHVATAVGAAVRSLGPQLGACDVALTVAYAAGTYAMLNVTLDACLQTYSDAIVNATYALAAPNQTAPSWVDSLPEPERSEKLALIKKYGSPNVFSQFQPHVTLAWSNDTAGVATWTDGLNLNTSFAADVLALGSVGDHGTVLKDKDMAVFNISWSRP